MSQCASDLSIIEYDKGYAIQFCESENSKPVYFVEKYFRFNEVLTPLSFIKTRQEAEKHLKRVREELDFIADREMVDTDEVIYFKAINISYPGDILGRTLEPENRLKRVLQDRMVKIEYGDKYCIDNIPVLIHNTFLLLFDPSNEKKMERILDEIGFIGKENKIYETHVERRGNHYYGLAGWDQVTSETIRFLRGDCAGEIEKEMERREEAERRWKAVESEEEGYLDGRQRD